MELTILGSGTCVPSLKRSAPASLIKTGSLHILIDCGPDTLHQLEKAKVGYKKIDFIFIGHYHPDHTSNLISFVQALNHTPKYTHKKDLTIVGPPGFKKWYKKYINSFPLPNTYRLVVKEIEKKMTIGSLKVTTSKTVHTPDSLAYRFTAKGKSVTITGDTGFTNSLAKFAKNSDLLLIECTYPNSMKSDGHLTPYECALIANDANVKKMILTHIHSVFSEKQIFNPTKKDFPRTVLAKDLMKVQL